MTLINMPDSISLPNDSRLYILDDHGVVFRESSQRLYGLNTFATYLWCCLESDESLIQAQIEAQQTFNVSNELITEWIANAIENWKEIGLIGDLNKESKDINDFAWVANLTDISSAPTFEQRAWEKELYYKLVDCNINVYLENATHAEGINSVLGHLSRAAGSETICSSEIHVCHQDNQSVIYRNRKPVAIFDNSNSIPPGVKSIALQEAIDHYDYQFSFHAGVVSNGKSLALLSGMAGAGKSTLTAGLMQSGLTYYSDEVALLNAEDSKIRPFPIALCSKSSAWPLMTPILPELPFLPIFDRLDGKRVRYIPPRIDLENIGYDKALPVKALIFPRYNPETKSELIAIDRVKALHHLMDECLSIKTALNFEIVESLIDWISSVECYELPNNNLKDSVALIKGLMA